MELFTFNKYLLFSMNWKGANWKAWIHKYLDLETFIFGIVTPTCWRKAVPLRAGKLV